MNAPAINVSFHKGKGFWGKVSKHNKRNFYIDLFKYSDRCQMGLRNWAVAQKERPNKD